MHTIYRRNGSGTSTITGALLDDLRDAIERIPPAEYLAMSYYERWLRAAEMLLAERGLLADD